MDSGMWYEGQTHPYHLQELPAVNPHPHLHNAAAVAAPPTQPAHYYQPPFTSSVPFSSTPAAAASVQYPYYPYPTDPTPIPAPAAAAPASSHLYGPPPSDGGATLQTPEVDAYAPNPYGPQIGSIGHAVRYGYAYPTVGAAGSCYHGVAGGDTQRFVAEEAIRQYGVDPVAYGNILRQPDFSTHWNKVARPRNGTTRRRKIAKVVQSAYCKVCKVDCNSQEVLVSHKLGKKHKKNLEKLTESMPKPAKLPMTVAEDKKIPEAEKGKAAGQRTKKKSASATEVDLEMKKRRLMEEGAAADTMRACAVCNIVCNSEVVYKYHIAGQKHAAMVKKLAGSTS